MLGGRGRNVDMPVSNLPLHRAVSDSRQIESDAVGTVVETAVHREVVLQNGVGNTGDQNGISSSNVGS
jgi:hypothetical protein